MISTYSSEIVNIIRDYLIEFFIELGGNFFSTFQSTVFSIMFIGLVFTVAYKSFKTN